MKKLLVLLLLSTTMLAQSTSVKGITLSYDRTQKTMTLVITPKSVYTQDPDMDVEIEIYKRFVLKTSTYSMTEPYFRQKGHIKKVGWSFITLKPQGCIVVKLNYVYQFINIEIGEEYILSVNNICEGKYRSDDKLTSLVTH